MRGEVWAKVMRKLIEGHEKLIKGYEKWIEREVWARGHEKRGERS